MEEERETIYMYHYIYCTIMSFTVMVITYYFGLTVYIYDNKRFKRCEMLVFHFFKIYIW